MKIEIKHKGTEVKFEDNSDIGYNTESFKVIMQQLADKIILLQKIK